MAPILIQPFKKGLSESLASDKRGVYLIKAISKPLIHPIHLQLTGETEALEKDLMDVFLVITLAFRHVKAHSPHSKKNTVLCTEKTWFLSPFKRFSKELSDVKSSLTLKQLQQKKQLLVHMPQMYN